MASYISSYFGSGTNQPAPQYGQYQPQYQQYQQTPPPTQSGSTWSNTFSSRIGALRKAITRDNEEDDPDNEDCSHISNVLRAYYMEKGRPFPEWLPPDPTKPVVTPSTQQPQFGQYGNTYPNQYGNAGPAQHNRGNSMGRGAGLSDLWDSGPSQPQAQAQAQSLRAPRPTPQALRSFDSSSVRQGQSGQESYSAQARPLPSQRAGSFQNSQSAATPPPAGNSRDRLRARLQGGSSGRSSPANNSQGAANQPWTNDGNSYEPSPSGYGNTSYQQRGSNYR